MPARASVGIYSPLDRPRPRRQRNRTRLDLCVRLPARPRASARFRSPGRSALSVELAGLVVTPAGGISVGGTALINRVRTSVAPGGAQLGGAATVATHEAVRTVVAAGGVQLGGAAQVETSSAGGA